MSMIVLTPGTVVTVPFPYTDLTYTELRPALLLADVGLGDWIAAQITTNQYRDPRAVEITVASFQDGSLRYTSYVRPSKLATLNRDLIRTRIGTLQSHVLTHIIDEVVRVLRSS